MHVWPAAAKSLQSCPTLWDPIDGSPRGSPIPGILQAGTLKWVAISFSKIFLWAPFFGGRGQQYWSGLPFPSPGDLPNAGTEPRFPALCMHVWPNSSQYFNENCAVNRPFAHSGESILQKQKLKHSFIVVANIDVFWIFINRRWVIE